MLLVFDVGNSNVKIGLFQGEEIRELWRLAPDPRRTADEYGALLYSLLQHRGALGKIEGAIIGSVVTRMDMLLDEACRRYLDLEPVVVSQEIELGIGVETDRPEEVGADLLAAAAAAKHYYGQPVLTLHLGTAAVLTAVSAEGVFFGCSIAPGPDAMLEGLVGRTSKLPFVPLDLPEDAVGRNTVTAMQSGVMIGFVALVEGLIKRYHAQLGRWTVVATGGYGHLLKKHTGLVDHVDPDLTLRGLRLIYNLNRGK